MISMLLNGDNSLRVCNRVNTKDYSISNGEVNFCTQFMILQDFGGDSVEVDDMAKMLEISTGESVQAEEL